MSDISFQGHVVEVISRNKDNIIFTIKTFDENTHKIFCPFFCPVQPKDAIFLSKCVAQPNGMYRAVNQPFVSIPEDPEVVKEYFVKILRGTKFGVISADRLYLHLYVLTTNLGKSKITDFLDDTAANYCESYDKNLLHLICNESDNKNIISLKQGIKLLTEWHNKRSLRKLYMLGLTKGEIARSGLPLDELYKVAIKNPYRVASIQYAKCELILDSVRGSVSDEDRICGKVNRYVYDQTYNNGNTCITEASLRKAFIYYDTISELLTKDYFLTVCNNKVYTNRAYLVETEVLSYVSHLIKMGASKSQRASGPRLNTAFYSCKTLTEEQKEAIEGALHHNISIITGGAGTGKSEVIKEITKNLSIREKKCNVCAFTGKAVSKLHSVMKNDDATTIDRLILEIHKQSKHISGHVIIDEGSMVTIELFHRLIKAIEEKPIQITIVGDCNQLPPIGWGNLMRELITCGQIPVFQLIQNQRIKIAEGGEKTILENANALIDPTRDFRKPVVFKEGNGFHILGGGLSTIAHIIKALRNSSISCSDTLILSPYRLYLEELNATVQEIYLEDAFKFEQKIPSGQRIWRVGDRVMMTKNNYSIKVMNGQEGVIMEIDDEGIKVQFNSVIYTFQFDDGLGVDKDDDSDDAKKEDEEVEEPLLSSDLIHSYAVSIHKSQGSEADYVILYLEERNNTSSNFLNINLLYTAITRTRKTIWVVCDKKTLERISTTPMLYKTDGLSDRLKLNI